MANRAYLFSSAHNDADAWKQDIEAWHQALVPYYDSRHNIPLAWWFLFDESDVLLLDIYAPTTRWSSETQWKEVRLLADKQKSLAAFARNKSLLMKIVGAKLDASLLTEFVATIASWPDKYLLMNPTEILSNEQDYEPCLQIVRSIQAAAPKIEHVVKAASYFSRVDFADSDEKEIRLNVIGYTYW